MSKAVGVEPSGLTVLMPAYNEAASLATSVARVVHYLTTHDFDYEILIVDDASTDDTAGIARGLAAANPRIRVLQHAENKGPCSGLRSGPIHAGKPWLLLLPIDLAIPLQDIAAFWSARDVADIVLGYIASETRDGARRVQSRTYTRIVNLLFGLQLRQVNYVALYRTELLRELPLTTTGVALHAEILVRAARRGAAITQIGVGYEPRTVGVSSGNKPRVVLKTLGEVMKLRLQLIGARRG